MKIPFGKYNSLPLTMSDGQDKCQSFIENARQTLDNSVYGLDDAKNANYADGRSMDKQPTICRNSYRHTWSHGHWKKQH